MSSETQPTPRPNRGRAAGPGNRRALISAAREIYASEGPTAPFSAIAKRAGVGQGSLYRHFPDRIALAVAVFEDNITDLEVHAERPDASVADLLRRVADQAMSSAALISLVTLDAQDPRVMPLVERFFGVVAHLVETDRAAGRIGAQVETADVAMAASMLAAELSRAAAPERPASARRACAIFEAAFAPR